MESSIPLLPLSAAARQRARPAYELSVRPSQEVYLSSLSAPKHYPGFVNIIWAIAIIGLTEAISILSWFNVHSTTTLRSSWQWYTFQHSLISPSFSNERKGEIQVFYGHNYSYPYSRSVSSLEKFFTVLTLSLHCVGRGQKKKTVRKNCFMSSGSNFGSMVLNTASDDQCDNFPCDKIHQSSTNFL